MALGALVLTATVSAFIGSFFSPGFAYRALNRGANIFRPSPPIGDRVVDEYVKQTTEATLWRGQPTVFSNSVGYMKSRFADFDPRRVHPYRTTDYKLWVPDVSHAAPVFAGRAVEVFGQIANSNLLAPPFNGYIEWVIQLRPITTEDGLIYCRVTRRIGWHPPRGAASLESAGVILAVGAIPLGNGHVAFGAYMACSAIAPPPPGYRGFTAFAAAHPEQLARVRRLVTDPAALARFRRQMRVGARR